MYALVFLCEYSSSLEGVSDHYTHKNSMMRTSVDFIVCVVMANVLNYCRSPPYVCQVLSVVYHP